MRSFECCRTAWATSCPSTTARSSSVFATSNIPENTPILPPCRQKALITSSASKSRNSHSYRSPLARAILRPTRSTRACSSPLVITSYFFEMSSNDSAPSTAICCSV